MWEFRILFGVVWLASLEHARFSGCDWLGETRSRTDFQGKNTHSLGAHRPHFLHISCVRVLTATNAHTYTEKRFIDQPQPRSIHLISVVVVLSPDAKFYSRAVMAYFPIKLYTSARSAACAQPRIHFPASAQGTAHSLSPHPRSLSSSSFLPQPDTPRIPRLLSPPVSDPRPGTSRPKQPSHGTALPQSQAA